MSAEQPLLGQPVAWRAATALAFTAGGVDSVGLSAVARYTAHMSGTTSGLAGAIAAAETATLVLCVVALASFVAGAAGVGLVLADPSRWSREGRTRALLYSEAALIALAAWPLVLRSRELPAVIAVIVPLAAAMGAQNRLGVVLAGGSARTTHVTGTLTDAGYHLGRWLRPRREPLLGVDDAQRSGALFLLFIAFLVGGVTGRFAWLLVQPLAVATLALIPIVVGWTVLRRAAAR